ncbi:MULTISPECIES: 50S ribosomal protein L23 [Convivina]|uniref:Large ribosomal subunit protein uL23 n=2 Tax=Convivina TaxID=1697027 RepID=A0A2U1D6V7_9LACO|nr:MULTISPECIES: 50S ribosomal protein L23 [Convivina]SDC04344.1 LSU ribosomal protein L23P [Leuconostocaceae bacterium R-53105]PVY83415.1 LSU ribosomal protein L23P [Convivina intestini]CAH1854161.1 50S ribosomal protein L23 [Convivina intestini]CAH1855946.1 50S ribosomal protein L23 [Convivina intestini]CAH1856250.1 50S ribosomal protein L23 [Convivina sp. LMG 32447]
MDARDIIRRPIITEASMAQTENKRYVFEVDTRATKPEIKKAIEQIFDVQVSGLNTANVRGKKKRQGRYVGYTRKLKKATVTLAADSKDIEIFNEG